MSWGCHAFGIEALDYRSDQQLNFHASPPQGRLAVAMALPKSKATGLLLGGFALLSLSQILPRNNAWTDYATLWKAAYEDRPSAFTAAGYGWAKENIEKDPLGARELYMEALRAEPAYHSVCEAAVLVNVRLKRFESGVAVADGEGARQAYYVTSLSFHVIYLFQRLLVSHKATETPSDH